MAVIDREDLLDALEKGDFARLVGTREQQYVEFKDQPYMLNSAASVLEWCKDVAAAANGGGACIVIGVETQRLSESREDVAVAYKNVPKRLVNIDQHYKLLREHLIPEPRGMRMQWYPAEADAGLLVIDVPAQEERDLPVIIRRTAESSDKGSAAIAVPVRVASDTAWYTPERLHRILNDDRARGATTDSQREWESVRRARMDARVKDLERESGWQDRPCFFLQAAPPRPSGLLSGMHEDSGVRGALTNPTLLRRAGFVPYMNSVEAREAGLAAIGVAKSLWLDKDGLLTVGGVITNDWFGRGLNADSAAKVHVNPLVLCEYTLEFCRFVHHILAPRVESRAWLFRVVGRRLQRPILTDLTAGDHRALLWPGAAQPASTDSFVEEIVGSDLAAKIAYHIVAAVYAHYGLPPSAIPFTDGETVSEAQIAVLR